jgi:hypothetical protein
MDKMKERGFIALREEVQAINWDKQTKFIRPIKLREFKYSTTPGYNWTFRNHKMLWQDYRTEDLVKKYYPVGMRLWVREHFAVNDKGELTTYMADKNILGFWVREGRIRPSSLMKRSMSRITLEITNVSIHPFRDLDSMNIIFDPELNYSKPWVWLLSTKIL